jgi:RHS repeat-associated protein
VGPVSGQTFAYDANDRITTETYDLNGNTLAAEGDSFAYDFEDRLVRINSGVGLAYDGDGGLISRTEAGVKTSYLVDDIGPSGWSQVVEEVVASAMARTYSYAGVPLRSGSRSYVADGHRDVRLMADGGGVVTDEYDYDGFGVETRTNGVSTNALRYTGERAEGAGLTFLRARHLRSGTGRFFGMDPWMGTQERPETLHRFNYAGGEPVMRSDPSGRSFGLPEIAAVTVGAGIQATLAYAAYTNVTDYKVSLLGAIRDPLTPTVGGLVAVVQLVAGNPLVGGTASWQVLDDGRLLITGSKVILSPGLTIGPIVYTKADSPSAKLLEHELQHTKQWYATGFYFLPNNLAAIAISEVVGGNYCKYNWNEFGPYSNPPKPFGPSPASGTKFGCKPLAPGQSAPDCQCEF